MNDWAREALGICGIVVCVILFMFFYPILYDSFGKALALLLSVGFFYGCYWLWYWAAGMSEDNK